jgi:para-nitrobenzyl esterase
MTIAETRSGKVEGEERDGVAVFKGIPYAAPPIGARRWLAPEREASWDGVRDATRFSAQSAQGPFAMNTMFGGETPVVSEDSLFLNVWTPACDDAKRPVMVWIHGGAFLFGSGDTPWYDGTRFAIHGDVVVVTINYRLGAFGFLHLADLFGSEFEGSGNCGILDQVAALQWVRESIAGFGGDPENVTVFGESAGGGSVGTLLGLPAARGLFRKAIAQSGASSWWATRAGATEIARELIAVLGVQPGDADALRGVSMQQLIDAVTGLGAVAPSRGTLAFQPVVDGGVLPQPPLDTIEAGNADGVRVLVGTNRHEMTLFNLMDPALADVDDDGVSRRVTPWYGAGAAQLVESYRSRRPDTTPLDLWTDVGSDAAFRIPAIRLAETQRAHGSTWMYLFTWETPVFGGVLRSSHALEIPFVFDNLDESTAMFTGSGTERQAIADAMHASWIAFARNGDPNHAGIPDWPQYDTHRRSTMRFDVEVELVDDPMGEDRAAWGEFRK